MYQMLTFPVSKLIGPKKVLMDENDNQVGAFLGNGCLEIYPKTRYFHVNWADS